MKNKQDSQDNQEKKKYEDFFHLSVWAFCRDTERIIRPYSTEDFVREYFIPDL